MSINNFKLVVKIINYLGVLTYPKQKGIDYADTRTSNFAIENIRKTKYFAKTLQPLHKGSDGWFEPKNKG